MRVGVDVSSDERRASPDLRPPTLEAVRRGIWLGKQLSAMVTFQACLDISAHTEEMLREGAADANRSVEAAALEVVQGPVKQANVEGVQARGLVAIGTPWESITRQVLRDHHDLLLVGTRRRGAASRLFFVSTSGKLIRHCPCPVWVTKPDPKFDDINMLVACDLGPANDHILHMAVGGGRLLDAKLHLLHVIEWGADQGLWHKGVSQDAVVDYRAKAREAAEQKLRQSLAHTDFRTITSGVQLHIGEGDADAVILEAIQKHGIDLLVMGTKARHGLPGLLFGNTAERLLSQVECSVFVVKPENFVCPITID